MEQSLHLVYLFFQKGFSKVSSRKLLNKDRAHGMVNILTWTVGEQIENNEQDKQFHQFMIRVYCKDWCLVPDYSQSNSKFWLRKSNIISQLTDHHEKNWACEKNGDATMLQIDFDQLIEWLATWQMKFYVEIMWGIHSDITLRCWLLLKEQFTGFVTC